MVPLTSAQTAGDGPDDVTDALVRAAFATTAVLARVAAAHDISLTQLRLCGILRDRRLRMSDLADFLGLEKSTLSGLVDRAQRRGLLARAPGARDGRAVEVFLTAAGAQLAVAVRAQVGQELSALTGVLPPAGQRRLQALLEQMLSASGP